MENEELLQEEEASVITLTDNQGNDVQFEYLDCIEYEGTEYLVLIPLEDEESRLVILRVEPLDEENENYIPVSDDKTLDAVYGIFKERYKDIFTFED